MKIKKIALSILLCGLIVTGVRSNVEAQDLSKFQALFMTKFIDYVNWPKGNDNLVIGVVGNSKVLNELQTLLQSKGKNATLKKLNSAAEASSCDMIFIPADQAKMFETINSTTAGKNVLIISETEVLAAQGSVITFYTDSGKLRFIINKAAASARNLQISGSLMSMAKVI
jgi:cellulose biosynthesis protein BcsQ